MRHLNSRRQGIRKARRWWYFQRIFNVYIVGMSSRMGQKRLAIVPIQEKIFVENCKSESPLADLNDRPHHA